MRSDILKIVVVDNDVLLHEEYKTYFENYKDFSLEGVYSSMENALMDYANTLPDIIILEVCYPFLTGVQSIRLFHKKNRHVKILMVSNKSDFEIIKKAFKNGANGYLTKPLCKKRLLRALTSIKYEGAAMSRDIVQKVISNFQVKSYNFFS